MKSSPNNLKSTIMILLLSAVCFAVRAQTIVNSGNDAINFRHTANKNYFLKDTTQHLLSTAAFKPNQKMMLANYALAYDTDYARHVMFDTRFDSDNKKYFVYDLKHSVDNPLQPYGNSGSALLCGTLNYLFYLIDK